MRILFWLLERRKGCWWFYGIVFQHWTIGPCLRNVVYLFILGSDIETFKVILVQPPHFGFKKLNPKGAMWLAQGQTVTELGFETQVPLTLEPKETTIQILILPLQTCVILSDEQIKERKSIKHLTKVSDGKALWNSGSSSQVDSNISSLVSCPLIKSYLFLILNHLTASKTLMLRIFLSRSLVGDCWGDSLQHMQT